MNNVIKPIDTKYFNKFDNEFNIVKKSYLKKYSLLSQYLDDVYNEKEKFSVDKYFSFIKNNQNIGQNLDIMNFLNLFNEKDVTKKIIDNDNEIINIIRGGNFIKLLYIINSNKNNIILNDVYKIFELFSQYSIKKDYDWKIFYNDFFYVENNKSKSYSNINNDLFGDSIFKEIVYFIENFYMTLPYTINNEKDIDNLFLPYNILMPSIIGVYYNEEIKNIYFDIVKKEVDRFEKYISNNKINDYLIEYFYNKINHYNTSIFYEFFKFKNEKIPRDTKTYLMYISKNTPIFFINDKTNIDNKLKLINHENTIEFYQFMKNINLSSNKDFINGLSLFIESMVDFYDYTIKKKHVFLDDNEKILNDNFFHKEIKLLLNHATKLKKEDLPEYTKYFFNKNINNQDMLMLIDIDKNVEYSEVLKENIFYHINIKRGLGITNAFDMFNGIDFLNLYKKLKNNYLKTHINSNEDVFHKMFIKDFILYKSINSLSSNNEEFFQQIYNNHKDIFLESVLDILSNDGILLNSDYNKNFILGLLLDNYDYIIKNNLKITNNNNLKDIDDIVFNFIILSKNYKLTEINEQYYKNLSMIINIFKGTKINLFEELNHNSKSLNNGKNLFLNFMYKYNFDTLKLGLKIVNRKSI